MVCANGVNWREKQKDVFFNAFLRKTKFQCLRRTSRTSREQENINNRVKSVWRTPNRKKYVSYVLADTKTGFAFAKHVLVFAKMSFCIYIFSKFLHFRIISHSAIYWGIKHFPRRFPPLCLGKLNLFRCNTTANYIVREHITVLLTD